MWHASKKLLINLSVLVCLVSFLPGWDAGAALASVNQDEPAGGSAGAAYQASNPSATITTSSGFKSAFTRGREASIAVTFTNTGASLTMVFSLTGLQAGWAGKLIDVNGDPVPPLGVVVPQSTAYTVYVRVVAGPGILEGGYTSAVLTATEQGNGANNAVTNLRFAVPSPFVYVMSDAQYLLRMSYLSPDATLDVPELLTTGGNNLAVSAALLNNKKYILGYENSLLNFDSQNVEFSIYNNVGGVLAHREKPFDHQNDNFKTVDSKPTLAASPSGKFGMAFFRASPGPTDQVLFQLFNEDGSKVAGAPSPTVITTTTSTTFDYLRLVGLPDVSAPQKMMVAVWFDDNGRIWGARLDAETGARIDSTPVHLDATSGALLPILAPLSDNRSFFAYSLNTTTIKVNDFDSNLLIQDAGLQLTGTSPIPGDALQFSGTEYILFAWIDMNLNNKFTIWYTLFDKNVSQQLMSPVELAPPNGLAPANISVTLDHQGRAMIFWTDEVARKYLYYALVDGDGNVVTPPMIFREAGPANNFTISPTGQGIVGLDGLNAAYLPVIRR